MQRPPAVDHEDEHEHAQPKQYERIREDNEDEQATDRSGRPPTHRGAMVVLDTPLELAPSSVVSSATPAGVVVVSSTYGDRLLARYRATRNNRWTHWALVGLFLVYLVVVPMILVLTFYLDFGQMLLSFSIAIAIPILLYHLLWRHMVDVHPGMEAPTLSVRERADIFFRAISRHWCYEAYQLLLTLMSCATYLFYTYHLTYAIDPTDGSANYSLGLPSADSFVQAEVFLIVSLAVDYLLHLMTVKHKLVYVFSFYSLVDLLCFTGVAYINFVHGNLSPHDAIYNYYLFQGVFRFLRMRRALQSLDAPIRNRSGIALYKLGPFKVTKKTAFFLLFGLRVFLFLCSAAALVLAFEFPCISLEPTPDACSPGLQKFHLCIYFIIVTRAYSAQCKASHAAAAAAAVQVCVCTDSRVCLLSSSLRSQCRRSVTAISTVRRTPVAC